MHTNKTDKNQIIKQIKELAQNQDFASAFRLMSHAASPHDEFSFQNSLATIYKKWPANAVPLTPLKVAVLASSTVHHILPILKFWLSQEGFDAEFYEGDYDTIVQTILNEGSDLYTFEPDVIWIFQGARDVQFPLSAGASAQEVTQATEDAAAQTRALWQALRKKSSALIIQNNTDIPVERVFGNFEANVAWSRTNLLRRYNLSLSQHTEPGVVIFDLDHISSVFGKARWFEWRFWYHSKHPFNLEAIGLVAYQAAKLIGAARGKAKKCLVLDLDNTLWGGVIGDDGVDGIRLGSDVEGEAFADFQKYILHLKERGIILAVCSKNEEAAAKEPFLRHPDMKIKLEDIAVFKANWQNKADNIQDIATSLNIGLDSLVFVDDNPAERALVKQFLPMVAIPEMPEDPTQYISTLDKHGYFETVSFSDEDRQRNSFYRDNVARDELSRKFQNLNEFLPQLQMQSEVGLVDAFRLPRVTQLINKSNQFNLTTIRYTEGDIQALSQHPDKFCYHFTLRDRFGDNGLISVLLLEKQSDNTLYINTWVMSCRVLSRGMEEFIYNHIADLAQKEGCTRILGEYRPTAKNKMVSQLYARLGFQNLSAQDGNTLWELKIHPSTPRFDVYIEKMEAQPI